MNFDNEEKNITIKDLGELIKFFSSIQYRSKDTEKKTAQIEETCIRLMSKDYANLMVIPNDKGQLSTSYPSQILIPERDLDIEHDAQRTAKSNQNNIDPLMPCLLKPTLNDSDHNSTNNNKNGKRLDLKKLKELISKARVARCRARFPIPAILYKNKYICRSATLSSAAEIYGRSVLDFTFNDSKNYSHNYEDNVETYEDDDFVKARIENSPSPPNTLNIGDTTKLFSHIRHQDINLLKYFQVKIICDLMLEKKKVKFGMNVTSSEKADKKNRYSEFNILSLPYPGCEFFKEYRDNSYCGEGLVYDWNQDFVDAEFGLLNCDEVSKKLNLNFQEYRSWDVIRLTQNYIKLMLYFLKECDSSILVHCISGWDRTPLFISLLRLTLWADGEIHQSLTAAEITYLTVAYDWFLFGHNLNDRLNKGEEIMFFCFQFLKFITGDDFSIKHLSTQNAAQADLITNNNNNNNNHHHHIGNKYDNNNDQCSALRKISTDSFSAQFDDFIIENIPQNFKGSSTSLNPLNNNPLNNKHEDSFSLLSTFDIEESDLKSRKLSEDSSENGSVEVLSKNINKSHQVLESLKQEISSPPLLSSSPDEMISTLTLEDSSLISDSNHFGESSILERNKSQDDSFEHDNSSKSAISDYIDGDLHSSTKPVEIPNHNNKNNTNNNPNCSIQSLVSNGSLGRSDSWQFVSEASSIIENHLILNHYSSPDSLNSLKKSTSPINGFAANMMHTGGGGSKTSSSSRNNKSNRSGAGKIASAATTAAISKRGEKILEVRSLFNNAYTSINFNHYNGGGCSLTNFVDQICRTVNI